MTNTVDQAELEERVDVVMQLGYASAATTPFQAEELVELLAKARRNNAALGVTGMLLYHEGSFLQVLEGDPDVVEALYAKIAEDPRHVEPLLLFRREEQPRVFGDWTMGFHEVLKDGITPPPGLNRFLQTGASGLRVEDGERVYEVMLGFRAGKWRRSVDA